jgi:hypothetical protein
MAALIRERQADPVVRVHEILRRRVELEDREDAAVQPELRAPGERPLPAQYRELAAHAHGPYVVELRVVEVVLVGSGEARPARVGEQWIEQVAARQEGRAFLRLFDRRHRS